ncbi:NitT/TauT family transport system substrate-binding protein [Roseomonas rosea]|uniref:Thiamine pyrimidine synthase n=1 Tax=Muricoccus roseus TaxID=198092 RepID=A0A1M6I5L1_9PROT|nr:ABC transporter substrate-binding protein [Roseomonas rosea]SHJ29705.1 NitT/TauT family transport system substrate-binding protein [Roseomonas rosea]
MERSRFLRWLAAAPLLAAAVMAPSRGEAQTPLRFAWDWAPQGYHAIWALAEERGFFRDAGLRVQQDRGYGSGDTITKVATGAYDVGFADINALVQFNARNPQQRVIAVAMVFDSNPAAVVTLRRTGIRTAADLAGRNLGAPEGESSRVLFPVFARAAGIDPASIRWTSMTASLRESMLATGQVEAITGLQQSAVFGLRAAGVPASEIVSLPYAAAGVDLYGHGVITSAAFAERNPEAVRGFVRATLQGLKAALADPAAGMAAMRKREALFDPALEGERFAMTRDVAILTPNVRRTGFGALELDRMRRLVAINAEVNRIENPPAAETLFSTDFLPPQADRMP